MKNAIILHGKPRKETYYNSDRRSASNSLWIPWLQHQLLIRDVPAQTPEMPDAWRPDYKLWSREFERYDISEGTLLVGHSCGAGFLVQWLSEHPDTSVGHVFLVAPWMGAAGTESAPEHDVVYGGFFDFEIDQHLLNRVSSLTLFHSDNDFDSIKEAVGKIRTSLPTLEYREFHNYGHFRSHDLGSDTFPELLETIDAKLGTRSSGSVK